jgi:predicted outer membrane lipoprotein
MSDQPKWKTPPLQGYSLLTEREWRRSLWKRGGVPERPQSMVEQTYWGGILWEALYPEGRVAINDFSRVKMLFACCVLDPEHRGPASTDAVRRIAAPTLFKDHYGRFFWPSAGTVGGGGIATMLTTQASDNPFLIIPAVVAAAAVGLLTGRWIEHTTDRDTQQLRVIPLSKRNRSAEHGDDAENVVTHAASTELLLGAVVELEKAQAHTSSDQMEQLRGAMRKALWQLTEEDPDSSETEDWAEQCTEAVTEFLEVLDLQPSSEAVDVVTTILCRVLAAGPAGEVTRQAVDELEGIHDDLVAAREAERAQDEHVTEPLRRAQEESLRQRRDQAEAEAADAVETGKAFRKSLAEERAAREAATRELRGRDDPQAD